MRVLVAAFAYNERKYIPYMVDYYRSQGCELLILDNMSTDGTYEWLIENKVATGMVDTDNSFHLTRLQKALFRSIHMIKPDWVIYTGIDTYFYFPGGILAEIEKAEKQQCCYIEVAHLETHNTGEPFRLPFQNHYFYIIRMSSKRQQMIVKYHSNMKILDDRMFLPYAMNGNLYHSDGFLINYGMCKPKEEREETFERRKRAWALGNLKGQGVHYAPAKARNWIWNKEEFIDIRTTDYYKMMK